MKSKLSKLKERVKITLQQDDYARADFFGIRQRDQCELNQIIARYTNKLAQQEETYKR